MPHGERYGGFAARIAGLSIALHERDEITQDHCDRVSGLALELGQACALSERELGLVGLVAGLHDIGKIGIPDEVLKKPTVFDEDDMRIMRTHPVRSERIVMASGLADGAEIAAGVRHHHERYDGGGYPDGLSGDAIPLMARIVAIVDTYDAMARMRMYGGPMPHQSIMRELHRVAGAQHDPYLAAKFAALIERSQFRVTD
jgi:HD-GYP domain-containing protein (c-di-GMP phosphodiesterase class II)